MKIKNLILSSLVLSMFIACAPKEDTAIIVNGSKIAKATFDGTIQNLANQYVKLDPKFLDNPENKKMIESAAMQELISSEVLAQEAIKQNIQLEGNIVQETIDSIKKLFAFDEKGQPTEDKNIIEKNFKAKLKTDGITYEDFENNIRKELKAKTLLQKLASEQKVELTEQGIQAVYDDVKTLLQADKNKVQNIAQENLQVALPFAIQIKQLTAERAQVSTIFLSTPKGTDDKTLKEKQNLAQKLYKDLSAGTIGFADAINKYSDDKNALKTNGEQLVIKGLLPEQLDTKIFTAPLGTILTPLTMPDGIYILRVNEKRAEVIPTYDELKPELTKYLAGLQIEANLKKYIDDLVSKAEVKVLVPELQDKPTETKTETK